jgi:hypothetical protein
MSLDALDRLDILDLYARYSHAVDAMDGASWIDCWVPDGEFRPSVGPTAGQLYRGHEALREFADTRPDDYPQARIWTADHVLVDHGDHVEGTCYGMTVDVSGPEPRVTAHYVYHDEIVRDGGTWRFRSRLPRIDVEAKR